MLGLAVVVGAALVTSSYYASKYAGNTNPNAKKIQADLALMKKELEELEVELVPWVSEERELLSYNQINNELEEGRVTTAKGVFTSVYNEPMIKYSYKKYISRKENALLYARTSNREYIYRTKNAAVTIYMNGQLIGLYENNQLLTPKNQLLAKIDKNAQKEFYEIVVEGKELGSIVNPINPSNINIRAFDLVDAKLSPRDESIFLAIAILEMLEISFRK